MLIEVFLTNGIKVVVEPYALALMIESGIIIKKLKIHSN